MFLEICSVWSAFYLPKWVHRTGIHLNETEFSMTKGGDTTHIRSTAFQGFMQSNIFNPTEGTFFWDYSIYSNSRIDGTCVLLGAISIPEWTECYSVHSAADSRIVLWRVNCTSAPVSFDHVSYSLFGIARDLFYWELIFCVFCYSYSEIGVNRIVPKERALKITSLMSKLTWKVRVLEKWHIRQK